MRWFYTLWSSHCRCRKQYWDGLQNLPYTLNSQHLVQKGGGHQKFTSVTSFSVVCPIWMSPSAQPGAEAHATGDCAVTFPLLHLALSSCGICIIPPVAPQFRRYVVLINNIRANTSSQQAHTVALRLSILMLIDLLPLHVPGWLRLEIEGLLPQYGMRKWGIWLFVPIMWEQYNHTPIYYVSYLHVHVSILFLPWPPHSTPNILPIRGATFCTIPTE